MLSFLGKIGLGTANTLDNRIKNGRSGVCPRAGEYLSDAGGIITTALVSAIAIGAGILGIIELVHGSKPSTGGNNFSGQQRRRTRR